MKPQADQSAPPPEETVHWPTTLPPTGLRRFAKLLIGYGFWALMRRENQAVRSGRLPHPPNFVQRQLMAAWVHQCLRRNEPEALGPLHAWLWREGSGPAHHRNTTNRFWKYWKAGYGNILPEIDRCMQRHPKQFTRLCEIGCGQGLALPLLKRHLTGLKHVTGLDLSDEQTRENVQHYHSSGITFENGDATQWIPRNAVPGTIYLTIGGVFEYFSQALVDGLFHSIARTKAPAMIALIETLPDDYDLESETVSRAFPPEYAMGHNYPKLLTKHGFRIEHQEELRTDCRVLLLVASLVDPA